jgi:uncharacterized protein (DUF2141 family)
MLVMLLRRLSAVCIAAVAASVSAWCGELVVVVDGIRNDKGDIEVTVYDRPEQWPSGRSVADVKEDARQGSVTVTIRDLPPGTYGITAFHDENSNGKLDTNFFGFPLEGFAFSNNVHPFLTSPAFKAVAIQLGTSNETITMHMQYLGKSD